jgi:hypothetical protein
VKKFIRLVEDAQPGLIAPGIPGNVFHGKVTSDKKYNSSLLVRQVRTEPKIEKPMPQPDFPSAKIGEPAIQDLRMDETAICRYGVLTPYDY